MTTAKEQAEYIHKIADMIERGELEVKHFNITTGAIEKWDIHNAPGAVQITIIGMVVPRG